ncbi:pheromone A receptor-domain-containing protein [Suillus bovinus]|uniref:pheromone A receptor-domain-containing protein n=1 Tax=Suillus bovinus TaxID=48563 RepID=UPI001B86AC7F|nr:pheromone A receptor-domain-containing protein [Suillus bovinus]KAG2135383.1 pheromone A receptor-domain-containing protein [Suillus bovinus]
MPFLSPQISIVIEMQIEIPVLSFISAALVLFPLPWYCRAGNIAAMSIGMWLSVVNMINAIDALRWTGVYQIPFLFWCDITSALMTAVNAAIPAACLCICIHLERMASFCQTSTPVTKRRRILLECLMCFGVPLVYAALHIIVQPRRFDVYENFGCRSAIYPTVVALFVVWIPPLALSFLTIVFCGITWHHFLLHGVQFSRTRPSSSLTSGAYIRLVSMAVSEVICTIAATVVAMSFNLSSGLAPWADFTRDLTKVSSFSSAATPKSINAMLIAEWAIIVAQSFFFIGLFVLGGEGRSRLHEAVQVMRRALSFCERRSTCIAELKGTFMTECDLTPVRSLTVLELKSTAFQSSTVCTYHGYSSEKPLPPPPAPLRPASLDLTNAKKLEENSEFLSPALLPLESPSNYSAIASSHNSLQSNFDPQQFNLLSTQWPEPPSTVLVRPRPARSPSMNFLHIEGSPFYGSAVPHNHSRNSKNRNAIYMTVVREVQGTY